MTEPEALRSALQLAGLDAGPARRCSETLSEPEKFAPLAVRVVPNSPPDGASAMVGIVTLNCDTPVEVDDVAPCRQR